jgi:hypothetical protein
VVGSTEDVIEADSTAEAERTVIEAWQAVRGVPIHGALGGAGAE